MGDLITEATLARAKLRAPENEIYSRESDSRMQMMRKPNPLTAQYDAEFQPAFPYLT